jgi:hypothetical protein
MWPVENSKDSDRAVNLGVGAASPLWPGFLMAAAAGVAYWGWTRWFRGLDGAVAPPADSSAPPAPTEGTPDAPLELIEPEAPQPLPVAESQPPAPPTAELVDLEPAPAIVAEPEPEPEPEPELAVDETPVTSEAEPAPKKAASKRKAPAGQA